MISSRPVKVFLFYMRENQKKLYILISITILCVIFIFSLISIYRTEKKLTNPIITTPSQQKVEPPLLNQGGVGSGNAVSEKASSVTVSAGDIKINLEPNQTFYNALIQAKDAGKIDFSGKNYIGLGFFVTDMGTLHAGSGKNLLYYINGKEAQVGVSLYTLKDGDIIEWKLE